MGSPNPLPKDSSHQHFVPPDPPFFPQVLLLRRPCYRTSGFPWFLSDDPGLPRFHHPPHLTYHTPGTVLCALGIVPDYG